MAAHLLPSLRRLRGPLAAATALATAAFPRTSRAVAASPPGACIVTALRRLPALRTFAAPSGAASCCCGPPRRGVPDASRAAPHAGRLAVSRPRIGAHTFHPSPAPPIAPVGPPSSVRTSALQLGICSRKGGPVERARSLGAPGHAARARPSRALTVEHLPRLELLRIRARDVVPEARSGAQHQHQRRQRQRGAAPWSIVLPAPLVSAALLHSVRPVRLSAAAQSRCCSALCQRA